MRALLVALAVMSPLVLFGIDACSSFATTSSPAPDGASDTPNDVGVVPADATTDVRGPFCVDGGPYDRCWDFSFDRPHEGFDDPNFVGEYIARRDVTTFTSAPGSWFSESRSRNPPDQSAARYLARFALKEGRYKITFDVRLETECPNSSIAELYCSTKGSPDDRGSMMRVIPKPDALELQANHNLDGGASFVRSGGVTLPITIGTWTHVEVEIIAGPSGSAHFEVGGSKAQSGTDIPIRCVGMTDIALLVGTQGVLPKDTRCAAWFDDVTITLP